MLFLITFCIVFLVQSYFYLFLFSKYTSFKQTTYATRTSPVSIVICAKNEAHNLKKLLPRLAKQEYPAFEIILIDDASSDSTLHEMTSFEKKHLRSDFKVSILQIFENDSDGKKSALSKGILAAKNDYILLTDGDCQPADNLWITKMTACFSEKTAIVLGYGAYEKIDNSVLNKLIRFETLLTAIQYFSYALDGKPYMGVGRNLAYKKAAFLKIGGFKDHTHVMSGDDDLFVSQLGDHKNVAICDDHQSFTISKPHTAIGSWIRQKRRHITTASLYKSGTKFRLGLFYMSQLFFYVLFLIAIITGAYLYIIIPLFFLRYIFWYATIIKSAIRLNEKDLIAFGPLYEISIIFIQLYIFLKNIISSPKSW